ncbi:MAG TPA: patatin-like phospholipase family protein [Candidatus Saccharimonadales bacterium]|jgi:predicted acylesterase/phospholipase RssA|nr:patatin-like phospholipase family protein [Candidatus Saccharimonadales bacterium]
MSRKKIGVALGGGILRGMAHIGALEVLAENDIVPDILTGCSSGALVAAAYGCGTLGELKKISLSVDRKSRRQMLDFCLTGEGLIRGKKMRSFFDFITGGKNFEDIEGIKLAFVGTDALTGKEVVIDEGNIAEALEITTALPGLAPLKRHKGRLVFDGGTAMLVPAKIAYDLGAEYVIAIDVGAERSLMTRLLGDVRGLMRKTRVGKMAAPMFRMQKMIINSDEHNFLGKARELMQRLQLLDDYVNHEYNFLETYLIGLKTITSDYERGIFHKEQADIAIRPEVFHINRSDVTKIDEIIQAGRKGVEKKLEKIKKIF